MHDQGAPSPQPRVWVPGGGSYCTVTDGGCASAVGVQVFNEYLQDISAIKTSDSGQRVACCGDCSVKVVHRTGMEFEVLLEVSLDRKPTIGEFLDKARSLYTSLPRPLGSTRVHSLTPLFRRSNGTTRRQGLLARRLTAFYMCMSCLAFEPSTVSRRWDPL